MTRLFDGGAGATPKVVRAAPGISAGFEMMQQCIADARLDRVVAAQSR